MKNAERKLWMVIAVLLAGWYARGDADLGLTKTTDREPARVGGALTYYLAITNRGSATATNVFVTDVIPSMLNFASCQLSQGTYTNDNGTLFASLGNLAAGATAMVVIVVNPAAEGVFTNEAGAAANNAIGVRASVVSTIRPANRSPSIQLPGPHSMVVGGTTSFVVFATDPDRDPLVTLTNTMKPEGAVFDGTNFSWTATRAFWNTTNWVEFVADDHQEEPGSIVTQRTMLVVLRDGDYDDMDDGWEWDSFGTLMRNGSGDADEDGLMDYEEFIAGTQPTNAQSVFRLLSVSTPPGYSNHEVRVATEPGRKYTIYWRDSLSSGAWMSFATTNAGVLWETGASSTNRVFVDDEGTNTTGAAPLSGQRFYRVSVTRN